MDGRMVKVGLIIMIDKKFLAITVGAVFVLGMYGPNVAEIVQSAEAHGVQAQLQSRFIQITNEAISRQSLSTGETLVLSGTLVSLVEREQRGWISLFSESTNSGNRWEIMARDPPGIVFEIPGNSVTNYAITAKALEPGVYHVHTQLNVANVGPGLGPGTTVVVEGDPILKPIAWGMLAYQSVMIAAAYVVTFATRPWQVI
jgi:methane/ammonia monooxygenase subunit B